ncbi:hypothetical protein VP236O401_P0052 [Vibrio phage 236O40-1]|nr:hypothetical protein VP236O401_P0052 [Vibrio phage 236O40-1]
MYEILILFISLLAFASVKSDRENWSHNLRLCSVLQVVHLPPLTRKVWAL